MLNCLLRDVSSRYYIPTKGKILVVAYFHLLTGLKSLGKIIKPQTGLNYMIRTTSFQTTRELKLDWKRYHLHYILASCPGTVLRPKAYYTHAELLEFYF